MRATATRVIEIVQRLGDLTLSAWLSVSVGDPLSLEAVFESQYLTFVWLKPVS